MGKAILFLADGMADEPLAELGGKTPVEYADTPNMDRIARDGASGTFLSLPEGFPTSSDVANMSVLGYDLAKCYCGRGPLEALSQGLELEPDDVAYRCNLIYADGDTLADYSGGHINTADAKAIMNDLAAEFNTDTATFHPGVSYRNLLILHGAQFTDQILYDKPDASQGRHIPDILPRPVEGIAESAPTCQFLIELMQRTRPFLEQHPVNQGRETSANMIWPWSPGRRPAIPSFEEKYGVKGAIISAVDVIFGLGAAAGMELIKVKGATGFVDTNYEGKADAAVNALARNDFIYLHVEAIDECGHLGDLEQKLQAIADFDQRIIGRVMAGLAGEEISYALAPDHPVPVKLRVHTRTPVPVAVCGPHIQPDSVQTYGERAAREGALGPLAGDRLMRLILDRG